MNLNTLKPAEGAKKDRNRVGRGSASGNGKTCGRGHKGFKSRSGSGIKLGFEGGQMPLHRRVAKFGFSSRIARETAEVNLSSINQISAEVITHDVLHEENLIHSNIKNAKIFLSGKIERPVTVKGIRVTAGARAAIEAAGGKVE